MFKAHSLTYIDTRWSAYMAILAGLVAASVGVIFIRFAQHEHIPSPLIAATRLTLATSVITPVVLRRYREQLRRLNHLDIVLALMAGFWLAIHFMTMVFALEHTSVLVNQVLTGLTPIWVAVIEVFFFKARLKRIVWPGLFFAILGGVIIALSGSGEFSFGRNPGLGITLAVGSSLAAAVYMLVGRSIRQKVSVWPYVWLVFGCAALTSLVFVFVSRTSVVGYSAQGYFWVLMVTLFPQLIGHSAFNYALGYLSATYVSLTGQLVVLFSSLLAIIVFHEIPNALQIPGSIAIIAGVVIVSIGQAAGKSTPVRHRSPERP